MAIRRVQVDTIPYTLPPGLYNPMQRWDTRLRMPVVLVHDDAGRAGVSQCMGPAGAVKSLAEEFLGSLLIGQDPLRGPALWEAMYRASLAHGGRGLTVKVMGAIDVALWDLRGQILGLPVHRLLGGSGSCVFAYGSGGLYGTHKSLDDLAAEMRGYVDMGFRAVKMKVGGVPLAEDVERVRAVRQAIGPKVQLMVDAAYALTAPRAIALAAAIERFDITFFETPVALESPEEMARVRQATRIRVAGSELLSTRFAFRDLIERGCVDFVQPNLTTAGGITETSRIIAMAGAHGFPCSMQCSGELELLGSVHVAAAHAGVISVEYHMVHRYLPAAAREATLILDSGHLRVPETPGLGIDPATRAAIAERLGHDPS
ncbi:MAG: mandelate racemase/muconate lactonizing enzyme family protein [Armatimonadetes bacterium]|nr:mandelate racemase/muconate lactonizing enzyme family protein [Armatimonadota bacterium]